MMLEVEEVHTWYGPSYVLKGLSLEVEAGTVVALLGRNGAGKSTTLKTIMGLVPPRRGRIRFAGHAIETLSAARINQLGIAYVPEERRIFGSLTVAEHLTIAAHGSTLWSAERLYELFPPLAAIRDRRGRFLSGGEQQMLAIARALVTGPKLLLLDEPSQGLAPVIVDAVMASIRTMKAQGLSILLVEQNLEIAFALAERTYVVDQGQLVFADTCDALRARPDVQERYLGVGT